MIISIGPEVREDLEYLMLARPTRPRARSSPRVHGDLQDGSPAPFRDVWALVRRIPRGRVMTYGQIAGLIEHRLSPRAVGWAMHGCPKDVPWQRVVNAQGACSTERLGDMPPGLQRVLLEREGIEFRKNGTLDLEVYRHENTTRAPRATRTPKRPVKPTRT